MPWARAVRARRRGRRGGWHAGGGGLRLLAGGLASWQPSKLLLQAGGWACGPLGLHQPKVQLLLLGQQAAALPRKGTRGRPRGMEQRSAAAMFLEFHPEQRSAVRSSKGAQQMR